MRVSLCVTLLAVLAIACEIEIDPVREPSDAGIDAGPPTIEFIAALTGAEEVPPVVTAATGAATFDLDDRKTALTWHVTHDVVGATSGHIHVGAPGTTGAVSIPLTAFSAEMTGTTAIDAGQLAQLEASGLYVNIHSEAHPGGEIRGQILRPGETIFVATLSGAEEVPANRSDRKGRLSAVLSAEKDALRYELAHDAAATAAHFHRGAAGIVGPVAKAIATPGATASATVELSADQVAALEAGLLYVNIHSASVPGGEIRGQLLRPGETLFSATLTGAQATAPVVTTQKGGAQIALSHDHKTMRYAASTTATATGAHFHEAILTRDGDVVVEMSAGSEMKGEVELTAAQADAIEGARWSFDIHTTAHAGGELRGQLLRPGERLFGARIGDGNAQFIVSTDGTEIRSRLEINDVTTARVHEAPGGVSGPEGFALSPFVDGVSVGRAALGVASLAALERGLLYVKAGEIRGQILHPGERFYVATLTDGHGGAHLILSADGKIAKVDGALVEGAMPTSAHVHNEDPAGIVCDLALTGLTFSGGKTGLLASDLARLASGGWYADVHTAAHPDGEVRGTFSGQ